MGTTCAGSTGLGDSDALSGDGVAFGAGTFVDSVAADSVVDEATDLDLNS